MTITDLLDAVRTRQADISTRRCVRYGITKSDTDYPAIFITIDDEGDPVGEDNYFVDEQGNELPLTGVEERAIADAIAADESDNIPTSLP